jgi:hypothetical protein
MPTRISTKHGREDEGGYEASTFKGIRDEKSIRAAQSWALAGFSTQTPFQPALMPFVFPNYRVYFSACSPFSAHVPQRWPHEGEYIEGIDAVRFAD